MIPSLPANSKSFFIMDKKSWFIVIICCALLGVQLYLGNQGKENTGRSADPERAASSAGSPAAADAAKGGREVDSAGFSPKPVSETHGTAANVPARPREVARLSTFDATGKKVATFAFGDVGGGVLYAEMDGVAIDSTKEALRNHDVRLNEASSCGIGTLMYNLGESSPPIRDTTLYKVTAQSKDMVELTGVTPDKSLIICKEYMLKPVENEDQEAHRYMLSLRVTIQNNTRKNLTYANWGLFAGGGYPISKSEWETYTYYVSQDDGDFIKENSGSFKPWFGSDKARIYKTDYKSLIWGGVMNQYYATLVIPSKNARSHELYAQPESSYSLRHEDRSTSGVSAAVGIPSFTVAGSGEQTKGGVQQFSYDLYMGPKLYQMLAKMPNRLDFVMDYGWLSFISVPMNWLINLFYGWFGNWGWAIIGMTFVIRGLIWPLHRKSMMSMRRMSLLQPKMQELKEKYGDDRQKINMEMMKLYQQYGINPASGCLPMLIQLPIFFAFFYMLQTTAEFRGEGFILWMHDLSQTDTVGELFGIPINVLPIVMAATQVAVMLMTPKAGDPTQQKIMMFMPLVFFLFCYSYPSALALYWTVQNLISIVQNCLMRRMPMPELKKVNKKKRGGFFERMMEAQRAALEEQKRLAKNARR